MTSPANKGIDACVMAIPTSIDSDISKLLKVADVSLRSGDAAHNLNVYQVIYRGIDAFSKGDPVEKGNVLRCLALFRMQVDLHKHIVASESIPNDKIPDIYKAAALMNKLLLKSAYSATKSGSQQYINAQCDALLNTADQIRSDQELRKFGFLNRELKDVIGRLREKANIVSVFKDEDYEVYAKLISQVEEILQRGNLEETGRTLVKLEGLTDKFKNKYIAKPIFLKYLENYRKSYIEKIKRHMNSVVQQMKETSLFKTKELVEELANLRALDQYHQDRGMTSKIRLLKKKIEKKRVAPVENKLESMAAFVLNNASNQHWFDYENMYETRHGENEIFSDLFYEYTLKGLSYRESERLLQKKLKKLREIELTKIVHINFEQNFEKKLKELIQAFGSADIKL